jgi:hypothetical protein
MSESRRVKVLILTDTGQEEKDVPLEDIKTETDAIGAFAIPWQHHSIALFSSLESFMSREPACVCWFSYPGKDPAKDQKELLEALK